MSRNVVRVEKGHGTVLLGQFDFLRLSASNQTEYFALACPEMAST